ncbi:expansin-A10 [Physcomitrium patens]|uniref:Expansin n=1 Tax=Physcomitrium patens TaxID=3218 RepID=Q84V44_PHYPA|nr:expansin-A10-like [Physcomitrium patens]AAL71869.1 expansin 3 [Physcomitrium patens]PNR43437.1 hypothetical protein PHYPA_015818 [Physcomitrium patens]|eukprot:XP_024390438.1 expansin-A10-like [Physcomitrella patens]
MAMATHVALLLVSALALVTSVQSGYAGSDWISGVAHATFYGGVDAQGTQGGACGYGNLYSTGYGTSTTALSSALFNAGLSCGACFELKCDSANSKYCLPGDKSITVTATNYCPQGSDGGWCDSPKQHFDLSHPMFTSLAQEVGGVIPVTYRRAPCAKKGGMRFTINGNPWFVMILVTNCGGAGDVQQLQIRGSDTPWYPCVRNWGQMWQMTSDPNLPGKALSFRATLSDGSVAESLNAAPSNWGWGQTFEGVATY